MKTKITFLALFIVSTLNINAQQLNVYYHAKYLADKYYQNDKISLSGDVKDILKKYYPTVSAIDTHLLNSNPFYKDFFEPSLGAGLLNDPFQNITSSIGGLDVTKIADGFAKFVVKRTKQELSIAFFEKFKEEISKEEYKDLRSVFPQTYIQLNLIGDEIYNYQKYILTLRASFENDLRNLPSNVPSIIDNHPDFFKAHKELEATLKSACYFSAELRDKVHPGEMLANYPPEYLDGLNPNWKGSIKTLQLFSESLRDTSTSDSSAYWVSSNQLRKITKDSVAFKIYLGLIYQQAKNNPILFDNGYSLTSILDAVANDNSYGQYRNYISAFALKTDKISKMIKEYQKPTTDSIAIEQFYKYYHASIDLIEHSTKLSTIYPFNQINGLKHLQDTLKNYFDAANTAGDLVVNVNRRNYSTAIVNTVHLYDLIRVKVDLADMNAKLDSLKNRKTLNKTIENKVVKESIAMVNANSKSSIDAITQSLLDNINILIKDKSKIDDSILRNLMAKLDSIKTATKDNASSIDRLINSPNNKCANKSAINDSIKTLSHKIDILDSNDIIRKMLKYGTMMATIVNAKNSDEVEAAIEAIALPTGSARIKRESKFNVAFNAYCGLYIGYEKIQGIDNSFKVNSYGVTAPIGVTISRGHSILGFIGTGKRGWKENKFGWSSSLFLSIFDIGALASFRFNSSNDSIQSVPKIELKDIISPGIFLSTGIPKTPLSINLGWQMGPLLRQVDYKENKYDQSYQRFSISLVVDLPLLSLYNKTK